MIPITQALRHCKNFQELNEPQVFCWRYLRDHLGVNELMRFKLERHGITIELVATLTWRNKAHRIAELIAYDEEHGYCLVGKAAFAKPPNAVELCRAIRGQGERYMNRLFFIASGGADQVHKNAGQTYKGNVQALRRKLKRG